MGRYQCYLKVLSLLSLITILQAPTARSFPFRAPDHNANEPPEDGPPGLGLAIPYVSSSSVYEYIVTHKYAGHTSHACQRPAYVVGKGQVKAACTTSARAISVITAGSAIVSSSTVMEYYTPVPRQDTTSFTSTSTTTIFVVPTPTSSGTTSGSVTSTPLPPTDSAPPQPAQSTTLPDSSLTSLTTSEVQTLTQAQVTNTSGVSQSRNKHLFRSSGHCGDFGVQEMANCEKLRDRNSTCCYILLLLGQIAFRAANISRVIVK